MPDLSLLKHKAAVLKVQGMAFSFLDRFNTDQAAPMTTPRACEVGIATLTDTGNKMSASGGKLLLAAKLVGGWTDPQYALDSQARAQGVAYCLKGVKQSNDADTSQARMTCGSVAGFAFKRKYFCVTNVNNTIYDLVVGTVYHGICVLQSTGSYNFLKGGAYTSWQLCWTEIGSNDSPITALVQQYQDAIEADDVVRGTLGGPFLTLNSLATNLIAAPTAGQTTTMVAEGMAEFTWTPSAGQVLELDVRRSDDDNRWIIRCDQAGNTIKIIERNAGVETERASAAQTWGTSTRRIVVYCQGNRITAFVVTNNKVSYASATFNATATGVKTSLAGANLITWPNVPGGAFQAELDKMLL